MNPFHITSSSISSSSSSSSSYSYSYPRPPSTSSSFQRPLLRLQTHVSPPTINANSLHRHNAGATAPTRLASRPSHSTTTTTTTTTSRPTLTNLTTSNLPDFPLPTALTSPSSPSKMYASYTSASQRFEFPRPPRSSRTINYPSSDYMNKRQVALHTILKGLSASNGVDTWGRTKTFLDRIHATGRRSQVLDIGTGTGVWAYQMANAEEYSDVTGIDIDISNVGQGGVTGTRHDNVNFEQVDVNSPLPFPAASFDVIHIRNIAMGVPKYQLMIERCARILRSGGMLIMTELELFYHTSMPTYSPTTCIRTWQLALKDALTAKGVDYDVCEKLDSLVSASGIFSIIGSVEEIGIPCGDAYSGNRFNSGMLASSFTSLEPILLEHGYGSQEVADLNEQCQSELLSVDSRYFQRVFTVCASKRRY